MANNDPQTPDDDTGRDLQKLIKGETAITITDPREAQRSIIERVFEATTLEDILGAGQLDETDAVLGVPILLRTFDLQKSTFPESDGGMPVYAVITADRVLEDGELGGSVKFTCGASTVLAQIGRMAELDMLSERPVKLVKKDKPTQSGFYPLSLVAA